MTSNTTHSAVQMVGDTLGDSIRAFVDRVLKHDGNTCEESQRICLRNAIAELEATFNGIAADDIHVSISIEPLAVAVDRLSRELDELADRIRSIGL